MQRTRVAAIDTSLRQDVFWQSADGIIYLVQDMDERYRANCCRFLIEHAALRYLQMRMHEIISSHWSYVFYAEDKDWGPVDDREPTRAEIFHKIRKEQDRGAHLDYMRNTPMFKALSTGIEHILRGWPGILPQCCATVDLLNHGHD